MTQSGKSDKKYKVGILGSYGGANLGDEAILSSMITQLRLSLPVEFVVFSRMNPEDTIARHQVERAIPIAKVGREELTKELKKLDLLLVGGGGILFNEWVKHYMHIMLLAQDLGIKTMTYAIGTGPLSSPVAQRLVRTALNNADVITVREFSARQVLEQIGVEKEINVTADPALLLEPAELPTDMFNSEHYKGKRLVGMSVREPGDAAPDLDTSHYHSLLANTADFIVDRFDAEIVFIPMEPGFVPMDARGSQDVQHSHAVLAQMQRPQSATVLRREYTSNQILTLTKQFDFVVGMRLHFLIFAALNHVPFVALPYASKVSGFVESLGITMPQLNGMKTGQLLAYIDRSWDMRTAIKKQIQKNLPALQERSRQNNDFAVKLLTTQKK